jgi:hypothetical protein
MFYRVEVWNNNSPIGITSIEGHDPAQAVRITYDKIRRTRKIPTYTSVYVMNENGDVWAYQYIHREGQFTQKSRRGGREIIHPETVHDIRAGNTTIRGALK